MRCFVYVAVFISLSVIGSSAARADIIGVVDLENLFINQFNPGSGSGISIGFNGVAIGATSGSGFTDVDLNGDMVDDVRVNMSYGIFQNGDSRIGFRNSSGSQLTMFSDSGTDTDFDYGFMNLTFSLQSLVAGYQVAGIPDITTSSLNGETELYEFGIIDTGNNITATNIMAYDANDYTGGDGVFSGAVNSLGDDDEILLPEHLGSFAGVIYDAEATITGDLGNNPGTSGNASDNIGVSGAGLNRLTLWYGGFDVGTDTNVGSPSASFNFSGNVTLTAVPEPTSLAMCGLASVAGGIAMLRRRRNRLPKA